jgi:ubiquinone/menaquinone biosynthesis C-methylase UbiE/CheY-like chemotaxis protein
MFFASQIDGTARQHGLEVRVVDSLHEVTEAVQSGGVSRLIVDLELPGFDPCELMAALPAESRPHVLGFGPHVKKDRLGAARDAGFDEVVSRGSFSANLVQMLQPTSAGPLPRTLEPEVMDTVEEAVDYDSMDHSGVNRLFVDDLLAVAATSGDHDRLQSSTNPLRILDVGTGTALIPIEFCRRPVSASVWAVDLAVEMLLLAERNVRDAGLDGRILLEHLDAKELSYNDGEFDWVISNSILHHIPQPVDSMREMLRVLRPGGLLFVRDLMRPGSDADVEQFVATYAGQENEHSQQLFRQSLHAALTVPEMQELMVDLGWPADCATQTSDRHWTIRGSRP